MGNMDEKEVAELLKKNLHLKDYVTKVEKKISRPKF